MLTSSFKARKRELSPARRVDGAAEALARLVYRARVLGLEVHNVIGDGNCFFRSLEYLLIHVLGFEAAHVLLGSDCTHETVRKFLCSWAEQHAETVIDDEGEETLANRVADAATSWPKPVAAFDRDGLAVPIASRFAAAISRMRAGEWADKCWARVIAPAALGFQISILSSAGEIYDQPSVVLPEWVPNHAARQQRHLVVGHMVVNGDGYHYVAARVPQAVPPLRLYAVVAAQLRAAVAARVGAGKPASADYDRGPRPPTSPSPPPLALVVPAPPQAAPAAPAKVVPAPKVDPRDISRRGDAALKQADYTRAARLFYEACKADPTSFVLFGKLAAALLELNQPEQAMTAARRSLELGPTYTTSYMLLAAAHRKLHDLPAAMRTLRKGMTCGRPSFRDFGKLGAAYRDAAAAHAVSTAADKTAFVGALASKLQVRCDGMPRECAWKLAGDHDLRV